MLHKQITVVTVAFRNNPILLAGMLKNVRVAAEAEAFNVQLVLVANDDGEYEVQDADVIQGHGNIGFARAISLGVQRAKPNDVVLLLNPDCEFEVDQIRPLLRRMRTIGSELLVPTIVDPNGHPEYLSYESWVFSPTQRVAAAVCYWFILRSQREALPPLVKAPGTCMALLRTTADRLGGPFDSQFFLYGEDRELSMRAKRSRIDLRIVREASVGHRGGESGRGLSEFVLRCKYDSQIRIAQRRYGRIGSMLAIWDMSLNAWLRGDSSAAKWTRQRWSGGATPAPLSAALASEGLPA